MKPFKIEIYVYADSEEKALEVQKAARDFVREKYQNGILVTADKLMNALRKFGNSMIVNQFFK
jgi:molecular chaperone GrpE (heat shock protein)